MATITEDYVSFETAKLLKEKGFDECPLFRYDDCGELWVQGGYNKTIKWHFPAPTLQTAMKWLREEKRTSIIIEFDVTKRGYCPYVYQLDYDMDWVVKWRINLPMKYEEAVEAAIKYCLEHLI